MGPIVLQYHHLFVPLIFLLHPLIARSFVQAFIRPSIFPFVDRVPGQWDSILTQTQSVPSERLAKKKKRQTNSSGHTTWCKRGPLSTVELFAGHIRRGTVGDRLRGAFTMLSGGKSV